MAGKEAQGQEQEVTGHIVFLVREQREMKTAVQFISFSVFSSGQNSGTIQTTFEVEAPSGLNFF